MHDIAAKECHADSLFGVTAEMLEVGKSKREIEDWLIRYGLNRDAASDLVHNVLDAEWRAGGGGRGLLVEVGVRHMALGAVLFALGVGATAGSVYFAEITGFYAVAYGAIAAGAINVVYGLFRFLEGS